MFSVHGILQYFYETCVCGVVWLCVWSVWYGLWYVYVCVYHYLLFSFAGLFVCLQGMERRGALLQYFHETCRVKLSAVRYDWFGTDHYLCKAIIMKHGIVIFEKPTLWCV